MDSAQQWVALGRVMMADEVRLVASNAVKELVHELIPAFEQASGHAVQATWGGTPDITRLAEEGGAFDLVVIPQTVVADLEHRGKLLPGAGREFVASAIGAATALGSRKFDVSTRAALKRSLLDAQSIVLSSGPSSLHLLTLFDQMGIRDVIEPKILRLAPGLSVGEALAQGRGQLGFTQVSELLTVQGIDRLGPLGPEVQRLTVFAFGVRPGAPTPQAAQGLISFLTSPAAAQQARRAGLEPR
ncbi:MAG: substrate-binding domain-containing protein [Burkholderiales bacterium]|nr:substrate-binding domain-containing protein [Burkholderiales bacterium]MDE1925890.1 substrate-binding domain-containing protein [Burkholderiales bacterium]MDE2157473.1 substrate-binding domain-containing protein [Burkholderiales bacterium]